MNLTNIHILSFCNERLDDLKFMHDSLENLNPKKRPLRHDVPENCRRRRTSSYLKHQIPRILKLMPSRHLLKKRKIDFDKRCRKHRRRPSIIFSQRSLHSENCDKNLWLETHVWHAKRMQMKNIWGFRLSTNNSGRGKRSIGKSLRNSCILHDSSYLRPIQLTGNIANIKELIEQFVDPQCHVLQDHEFLGGQKEIEVLFYKRHHFPKHCIGPITLCYNPVTTFTTSSMTDGDFPLVSSKLPQLAMKEKQFPADRMIWLWTHPSFFSTLLSALQLAVGEFPHISMKSSTSSSSTLTPTEITSSPSHDEGDNGSHTTNADTLSSQVQVQQVPGGMIRFSLSGSTSKSILKQLLNSLLPPTELKSVVIHSPNTPTSTTTTSTISLGSKASDATARNDWLLSLLDIKWDSSSSSSSSPLSLCPCPWTHGRVIGFTASIENGIDGSSICRRMVSSVDDSRNNDDGMTVVNNVCNAEKVCGQNNNNNNNNNKDGKLSISHSKIDYFWRPDAANSTIWKEACRIEVRQAMDVAKATRNTYAHKVGLRNMSKHHMNKPSSLQLMSPVVAVAAAAVKNDNITQKTSSIEFPLLLVRKDYVSRINRQGSDLKLHPNYSCRSKNSLVTPPWYHPTRTARLSGWDLIAPAGVGNVLWQALLFSSCHPIGIREMEILSLESGVPSFPRDYPDTTAGREYWKELAQMKGKGSKRNRWKVEKVSIPWMKLFTADTTTTTTTTTTDNNNTNESGFNKDDHPVNNSIRYNSNVDDCPCSLENKDDDYSNNNNKLMIIESSTAITTTHENIDTTLDHRDTSQQQLKTITKKRTRNRIKLWDATGLLVVRGQLYTSAFLVPTSLRSTTLVDSDTTTTTAVQNNNGGNKGISSILLKQHITWCTPSPLSSASSSLPTLIGVRVWVAGRGVLSTGAQLLAPSGNDIVNTTTITSTTEDTAISTTDYQAWLLGLEAVHRKTKSLLGSGNKRLGLWRGVEYNTEEKANDNGRISVGFVTSGDVSVTCGVSIGIGMCNAFLLHKLQRDAFYRYQLASESDLTSDNSKSLLTLYGSNNCMLVMFHNQRSFWCRPALIEII